MQSIAAVREAKAAKINEARALLNTENLSAEGKAAFDKLKADITALETDEARAQFLADAERRAVGERVSGEPAGLGDLEKRVSLLRVVQAAVEGRSLDGAEREYSQELERRSGRKAQGTFVPLAALEKRTNLTTTAGDLVPTDHRGDLYVGALRNSLVVRGLGVRTLTGLRGNLEVPKFGTGTSAAWVNENEAIPDSDMTFASITMTPRHVGAISSWSRQLAMQSDPSIEQLLRDDLAYVIGAAVDSAILTGDGVKEPLGILGRTASNGDVQTASIPATWADVLDIEQQLAAVNVVPNAWYTSPAVLTGLRKVLKAPTAGSDYIATAGRIGEIPAYTSNAAPASTAVLGDWSQVLFASWSGIDLLLNPYETEAYKRGNVLVRAILTCDVGIRHEQAFVVAS